MGLRENQPLLPPQVTQFLLCHTSSISFLKMNIGIVFFFQTGEGGKDSGYMLE